MALLGPAGPGPVLVGAGPSEVERLIPWDRAEVAALLREGPLESRLRDELASFEAAVAYTRNESLLRNLASLIPLVLARDPIPPAGSAHAADWLAEAVGPLARVVPGRLPRLEPTPAEAAEAHAVLETLPPAFLAIHPGSGSASKNWPAERFASLVETLASERPWLLIEGPADSGPAGALRGRRGAVGARERPVRLLGAMLARCGAFVGNDSGVAHLAAAFGARTVALFGPTDPAVWGPPGERVRVVRSRSGAMDGIDVREVLEAVSGLMAEALEPPARPVR